MVPELELMRAVAREAARLVMEIYATDFEVELKGEDDPVTRADKEANRLICERLAAGFPSHGIVAEESAPASDAALAEQAGTARTFFVDPVDGTREFAAKNGEFCVMIGLAEGGRALAGVIAVPVEDVLLSGEVGVGATTESLAGDGADRAPVVLAPPSGEVVAVVSRSHRSDRTTSFLASVGVTRELPCGSVGVKAARVLAGRAHLYVHPGGGAKLWDGCAPDAIVRAAGGSLTDAQGTPIDYRGELGLVRGLLAGHPSLVDRVAKAVREELARSPRGT